VRVFLKSFLFYNQRYARGTLGNLETAEHIGQTKRVCTALCEMWERCEAPPGHDGWQFTVAMGNRCKVKGLPAPVHVAYAPGFKIVIVSCNWKPPQRYPCPPKGSVGEEETDEPYDSWDVVQCKLGKLGWVPAPLEWWRSDTSPLRLPRFVGRPDFVIQKGESTFDALQKIGVVRLRNPPDAHPWDIQPIGIRRLWRGMAASFFGFPVPFVSEDLAAFRTYTKMFIPRRWQPRMAQDYASKELGTVVCPHGFFSRILDLFVSCGRTGHVLWARDTEKQVRRLARKLMHHLAVRTPWIKVDLDDLYWNYLCDTACELVWYREYQPNTVIEFMPMVVGRLLDDAICEAPVNDWLKSLELESLTIQVPGKLFELNFPLILADICRVGVRRFQFPVIARQPKRRLKQRSHRAYFCALPYRKRPDGLIDPNFVEIPALPCVELQALRLDLPMLPLLPKSQKALLNCIHAAFQNHTFISQVQWCCPQAPVVFLEDGHVFLHTLLYDYESTRVMSKI
jgi:hypothetical protein